MSMFDLPFIAALLRGRKKRAPAPPPVPTGPVRHAGVAFDKSIVVEAIGAAKTPDGAAIALLYRTRQRARRLTIGVRKHTLNYDVGRQTSVAAIQARVGAMARDLTWHWRTYDRRGDKVARTLARDGLPGGVK